jgi:hypothetical protein
MEDLLPLAEMRRFLHHDGALHLIIFSIYAEKNFDSVSPDMETVASSLRAIPADEMSEKAVKICGSKRPRIPSRQIQSVAKNVIYYR